MPRGRTTRNKTKRPGPTIPAGDEGASIDVECRKEKVKTLIQDFENEGCSLSPYITVSAGTDSNQFLVVNLFIIND